MGVLSDKMDTFVKYQSANALREAASNPGDAGVGTQLGAGLALGEMMRQSLINNNTNNNTASNSEEDEKFCPDCGAGNPRNAKFCCECGSKLAVKGKCPNCNAAVSGKSKFCPECGEKLK